jgi:hypothetical protein
VVRATLDSLGAHQVKVLPASDDMLNNSLEAALTAPEVDWSAPRPPEWIRGGTWGSQRTVLFSGMCIGQGRGGGGRGVGGLVCTLPTRVDSGWHMGQPTHRAVLRYVHWLGNAAGGGGGDTPAT